MIHPLWSVHDCHDTSGHGRAGVRLAVAMLDGATALTRSVIARVHSRIAVSTPLETNSA